MYQTLRRIARVGVITETSWPATVVVIVTLPSGPVPSVTEPLMLPVPALSTTSGWIRFSPPATTVVTFVVW